MRDNLIINVCMKIMVLINIFLILFSLYFSTPYRKRNDSYYVGCFIKNLN